MRLFNQAQLEEFLLADPRPVKFWARRDPDMDWVLIDVAIKGLAYGMKSWTFYGPVSPPTVLVGTPTISADAHAFVLLTASEELRREDAHINDLREGFSEGLIHAAEFLENLACIAQDIKFETNSKPRV